jgi:MoaA/NifB/PqqE/SkfB family radical SAM enzyme
MLLLCNYYVTYRCNAYCDFCHFGDHSKFKNTKFAKLDDFFNNVEQIAKLGVKFLDLTGGEPLLHKNIVEMVEFANSKKLQTSITTNGLLYHKYAKRLAGKVNLLHFSLDSPTEEIHNKIRGVDCFQSVIKSIELAKQLGEFPDILFTVTNETFESLPEMHQLALKYDLVLIVNPVFSYFGTPGLTDNAIEYIENFIKGKSNIYLNQAYLELRKNGGNKREKPLCKAVSRVIVISPDNEIILPCYHFGNERIKIDRPIKEIRNSLKLKELMKMEGRFDFCEGCTVNCYFEPSFAFPTNRYGLISLPSKIRYSYHKLIKQKYFPKNSFPNAQVKE